MEPRLLREDRMDKDDLELGLILEQKGKSAAAAQLYRK